MGFYTLVECGKERKIRAEPDANLNEQLINAAIKLGYEGMAGNTISTDDYYEAQARMDGAFCDFTEAEKMDYLKKCHDQYGVRNFEMEATMMMAFCSRAKISCAVICVTYLNRLLGDRNAEQQIDSSDFEMR